jgi:hypothetical protein
MSKIEVNQISSQCGSTLTIGQSGDTVTLACGATQSGFGRTGTVDWCTTAKTAPFTGASGKGYFVNTTCGAVTVTLPATPTAGDIISIKDYARTAATNNINFCRNGSKMDGTCSNSGISTNGDSTTLIYVDGTKGWTSILDNTTSEYGASYVTATGGTVTTCGNYKIHTFNSDATFCVSTVGNPAGSTTIEYLVIAGGGASGGSDRGGGGGAGGYRYGSCFPVSVQAYPITVGGGGSVTSPNSTPSLTPSTVSPSNGNNSIFNSITSTGGGRGGVGGFTTPASPTSHGGGDGGSGGGGGTGCAQQGPIGTGNTPPTTPSQGNSGGLGNPAPQNNAGGGGGGAGGAGVAAPGPGIGGAGGAGSNASPIDTTLRAGGGGGNSGLGGPSSGAGGTGGGGAGSGESGTINTGSGGGGGSGLGGSGVVIIKYLYQ